MYTFSTSLVTWKHFTMATGTASVSNAFLHCVSSEDFDSGDQHALQDNFRQYFGCGSIVAS